MSQPTAAHCPWRRAHEGSRDDEGAAFFRWVLVVGSYMHGMPHVHCVKVQMKGKATKRQRCTFWGGVGGRWGGVGWGGLGWGGFAVPDN